MSIKEIIRTTALLLGRENVVNYLDGNYDTEQVGEDCFRAVKTLADLANLVINELCATYIPMTKVEDAKVTGGRVYYKDLTERAIKIRAVYDKNGEELYYTKTAEYICVNYPEVAVEYDYVPENYGLEQSIGYTDKDISARVIANGVAAEFCITEGRFDEAVTFHKRYIDALSDICLPKNVLTKKRRWC